MVFKNIKNIKTAPTCFDSRWNHPQGVNVEPLLLHPEYSAIILNTYVWTNTFEPYL